MYKNTSQRKVTQKMLHPLKNIFAGLDASLQDGQMQPSRTPYALHMAKRRSLPSSRPKTSPKCYTPPFSINESGLNAIPPSLANDVYQQHNCDICKDGITKKKKAKYITSCCNQPTVNTTNKSLHHYLYLKQATGGTCTLQSSAHKQFQST